MTEDNLPQANRRTALKTIGAGMLAVTGPMVGSAAARSPETVVFSIQRNQDNGIDAAEYDKILARLTREAKLKAGVEQMAVAKPELSDGEEIFSLTFIASPDGYADTYIGSATRPRESEVNRLHDRAAQFQKRKTAQSTEGGLSTQQSSPEGDFIQVGGADWEKIDKPYGIVTNISKAYHNPNAPNSDVWGAAVDATFEPGAYTWDDSGYEWQEASVRHYWGRNYEPGGATLGDHAPEGDESGDTTVEASVSIGDATLGVTYTPPEVERYENSSSLNDNVRMKWEPGSETTEIDRHEPSVVSYMQSDNYASIGDNLAQTDARMSVLGGGADPTLSTPLTLQYDGQN